VGNAEAKPERQTELPQLLCITKTADYILELSLGQWVEEGQSIAHLISPRSTIIIRAGEVAALEMR